MSAAPVVIAGGGTGGHVTPALALGEAYRSLGISPCFIGGARGIEGRLVPQAGFELVRLDARPLVGRSAWQRVTGLLALARSTARAWRLLRARRTELVISVGGYASAPAGLAAALARIPLALVNTDAVPGAANRLLARFAGLICVGFPGAADALAKLAAPERVLVTGVPLREALRQAFAGAAPQEPDAAGLRHLFVFGGSQGARQINDLMLAALPSLDPQKLRIVHQTGASDRERVAAAYAAAGFEAEVLEFEADMPRRYRWAQLVVCRAGAISVAELALAGRASLLIPLAHVGGGEQFANARELTKRDAAQVLDSRQLGAEEFASALCALLADPERLDAMGRQAAGLARPRAAEEIVGACEFLRDGGRR